MACSSISLAVPPECPSLVESHREQLAEPIRFAELSPGITSRVAKGESAAGDKDLITGISPSSALVPICFLNPKQESV